MPKIQLVRTFREDLDARAVYAEAAGIARIVPRAIAVPETVAELQRLVVWAAEQQRQLIPRGSGSSMSGAAIGPDVIVDLSRWRELRPIDRERRTVRAGPGVLRAEVDAAARKSGLRFPVDPSSGPFCTVGGMAATNASGPHSLSAGSMRQWVQALDCVFADGTAASVRRGEPPPQEGALATAHRVAMDLVAQPDAGVNRMHQLCKNSSGYALEQFGQSGDLIDLLVGSEGTLAFFTGVELRLEAVPNASRTVLGSFAELSLAAAAAAAARRAGAAACELLDKTFLDLARPIASALGIPDRDQAVLLVEVEAATESEALERAREVERAFLTAKASLAQVAPDVQSADRLWSLRHAASPTLARLDPSLKSMQFIEDGAVPPDSLPAYVQGIRDILDRHATRGVIFGHAGDAHVHVNPLVDVASPEWRPRLAAIFDEAIALTARLGGTLTGEHGDGRLRTPVLDRVWPETALAAFRHVKQAFDPNGILNPGVKVGIEGQRAIDQVKYDPSLPELPSRAASVLAAVERDRDYARARLELLDAR